MHTGVTRSDAMWLSLAVDFVANRLKTRQANAMDVVSVVSMQDHAKILVECQPTNWVLFNRFVNFLRSAEPGLDGHYVPALNKAKELLHKNKHGSCALSLAFFSDGRPSDRFYQGVSVKHRGRTRNEHLNALGLVSTEIIASLASTFGRRLSVATVGIASEGEDFSILQSMAGTCCKFGVQGTFNAVGFDAGALSVAVSNLALTLNSTQIEMTQVGGSSQRQVRDVIREPIDTPDDSVFSHQDWHLHKVKQHFRWAQMKFAESDNWYWGWVLERPLEQNRQIAVRKKYFGEGAERIVRTFREVDKGKKFVGESMVAKESRFVLPEDGSESQKFHEMFCQSQTQARHLANKFNKQLAGLPGIDNSVPRISFLDCTVYVLDNGVGVLVEKKMQTDKFMKWNSNDGIVANAQNHVEDNLTQHSALPHNLGGPLKIDVDDIPQVRGHINFTYI